MGVVLSEDGKTIFAIPAHASHVLKFDTVTQKACLVGNNLGTDLWKWTGGVRGNDGMIYGIPHAASHVLRFNPETNRSDLVGDDLTRGGNQRKVSSANPLTSPIIWLETKAMGHDPKWNGGVLGPDGIIYGIPCGEKRMLRFDPDSERSERVGNEVRGQWTGGVYVPRDGCIYAPPRAGTRMLRYHLESRTASLVGAELGSWPNKWFDCVVAADQKIYAMPSEANYVLKFDPATQETSRVGTKVRGTNKYRGTVLGQDGAVYGIPQNAKQVLRFDPVTQVTSYVGDAHAGLAKWYGGVVASDGIMYGMACNARQILMIMNEPGAILSAQLEAQLALEKWNPATSEWTAPIKCVPALPIVAYFKPRSAAAPEAFLPGWEGLMKLGREMIERQVEAARASEAIQLELRRVYEDERVGSLRNYADKIARVHREPSFPEFTALSQELNDFLKLRPGECKQSVSSFPLLRATALELKPDFDEFLHVLARKSGTTATPGPLKGAWRAIEKMVLRDSHQNGSELDASLLCDVLRGGLVAESIAELLGALDLLKACDHEHGDATRSAGIDLSKFKIRIIRTKCRFTRPTSGGWADLLVNFIFVNDPSKHIVELQLQHKQMLLTRKEGGAHSAYNTFRSAYELLETIGMAPKDQPIGTQQAAPMQGSTPDEVRELKANIASLEKRVACLESTILALKQPVDMGA